MPQTGGTNTATTAATPAASTTPNYNDTTYLQTAATAGSSEPVTQAVWATMLILALKAQGKDVPVTLNNIENIERWMSAEEPSADWYDRNNPLNASVGTSASDGTGSYANLESGAQNTAKELTQSNFSNILSALTQNASPAAFSAVVVSSPWASSHYGVSAAGAPAKYVEAGRGLDYISTLPLAGQVSAGTGKQVAPADAGAANAESDLLPGDPNATSVGGLFGSWEDGLLGFFDAIESPKFWERVGLGAFGIFMVIIGGVLFFASTKTGQKTVSDGAEAATVAAVAA
jgi:hypothetical protein